MESQPGNLNSSDFAVVGAMSAAQASSATIVFNSSNGKLFYNENGEASGLGQGGHFATLKNGASLEASDIALI